MELGVGKGAYRYVSSWSIFAAAMTYLRRMNVCSEGLNGPWYLASLLVSSAEFKVPRAIHNGRVENQRNVMIG